MRDEVQQQPAVAQLRVLFRLRLTPQHLTRAAISSAGKRFFGQVIVAAGTQPTHALAHTLSAPITSTGVVHPAAAQGSDDIQAVVVRQHAVERYDVVTLAHRELQLLPAGLPRGRR